jgi:hypothetical protein
LDNNAEKMFLKNISNNSKNNSSNNNQSKKKKNKKIDFLKNGVLDYSLDSNSILSNEERANKDEETSKKIKKNFILKSELFSSFENDKKMKSEKASPKPSFL